MRNAANTDELKAWIGRTETLHDVVTAAPIRMLRATLDLPADAGSDADSHAGSDVLPPLWHWLYFLP